MPPRIPLPKWPSPAGLFPSSSVVITPARSYTTAAITYTPPTAPGKRYAPTQPPSHRAADARKTQLHRAYLSMLRSTPLMLIFQHNNFRSSEWVALRRELAIALSKLTPKGEVDDLADNIKINVLRGAVFQAALRVAEYYDSNDGKLHGTSREAYEATEKYKKHALAPLFAGPVGVVTFPAVSPVHLKTVLEVMFPEGRPLKGMDPMAVSGLQKLVLLAARVDGHVASGQLGRGRVMDGDSVRWISALPGFEGLRGQLVGMLQNVGGADLVRNLEAIPVSVVRTVDAHKKVLGGELEGQGENKET